MKWKWKWNVIIIIMKIINKWNNESNNNEKWNKE